MLSTPRFLPGAVDVSWRTDSSDRLTYTVRGPGDGEVALNAGMMVIALMADGSRNLGEIYDAVLECGIGIDDPVHVVLTFRRLEQADAVEMTWHFESAGPIRHTCLSCGHSCEGLAIGPLSDQEVERLVAGKQALTELEPDLPDLDPVVLFHGDQGPEPVLNTSTGRCVFLTKDRLCALHKHFGIRRKPLRCQLFPYRVVETEAGFRVGVSSRCAMAHRSYRTAPAQTAEKAVAAMRLKRPPGEVVGLDPGAPRSLRYTAAFERNQQQEAYFLALLSGREITLTEVLASADGTYRAGAVPPAPYLEAVARNLKHFGEDYEHDPLDRPGTVFGDGVRSFLSDLRQLPEKPAWAEPEAPVRAYLLHALRQFVYLRETTAFGGVEIAVQVTLMGVLGALWTTSPWAAQDAGPSDLLGRRVAYWMRIHNGGRARDRLFESFQHYAALRRLLSEPP